MFNANAIVRLTNILISSTAILISLILIYQTNASFYDIFESIMNKIQMPITPLDTTISTMQISDAVYQAYISSFIILFAIAGSILAFRYEDTIGDLLRSSHHRFY